MPFFGKYIGYKNDNVFATLAIAVIVLIIVMFTATDFMDEQLTPYKGAIDVFFIIAFVVEFILLGIFFYKRFTKAA